MLNKRFIENPDHEWQELIGKLNKLDNVDLINTIREHSLKDESYFVITITTKCNLSCAYCFQNGSKRESMSAVNLNKVVNKIVRYVKENNIKIINIDFFGGEPFLETEKIIYATKKLRNLLSENRYKLNISLITNGLHIDSEFLNFCLKSNFTEVQVTFDGTSVVHNKRRKSLKSGENNVQSHNVFETVLKNIPIFSQYFKTVKVKYNIDIETAFFFESFLDELENIIVSKENYIIVLEAIQNTTCNDYRKEYKNSSLLLARMYVDCIKLLLDRGFKYKCKAFNTPCMANNVNSFLIKPNLKVSTCISDFNESVLNLGTIELINLKSSKSKRKYLSRTALLKKHCNDCPFLIRCNGGCIYELEANKVDAINSLNCRKEFYFEFLNLFYEEVFIKEGCDQIG